MQTAWGWWFLESEHCLRNLPPAQGQGCQPFLSVVHLGVRPAGPLCYLKATLRKEGDLGLLPWVSSLGFVFFLQMKLWLDSQISL